MSDRSDKGNEKKQTSPSAAAFVGGYFLPSINAEKLGKEVREYKRLWESLESENEYDKLPELYNKTLEKKRQLEDSAAIAEITSDLVDPDYGSA